MNPAPILSDCATAVQHGLEHPEKDFFSESQFNNLALQIFRLQLRHNPVYQLVCRKRGCHEDNVTHWKQIPALPTSAFKDFEVTCLRPDERRAVFHSSGTTEHRPSRHFHSTNSLRLYESSALHGFLNHLPRVQSSSRIETLYQAICLTPPPAQAPHSSLVHMFETIRRHGRLAGFDFVGEIDPNGGWTIDVARALASLAITQPVLLLGTAFSYVQLLDHLADRHITFKLAAHSVALETGGYKGRTRTLPKSELHDLIRITLGIAQSHIVCEYGMSELSSQAYASELGHHQARLDAAENSLSLSPGPSLEPEIRRASSSDPTRQSQVNLPFHFSPWARSCIVSPETGAEVSENEIGLVRVIDLANVYSVIAVQTEDLAIRRGPGFELLGRAAGAELRGCSTMSVQA